jgi:hypothetical protein
MTETDLPTDLADDLVEMLFRDASALSIRDVLVVGPDAPALVAAVRRYVDDTVGDGPTVHAPAGDHLDATPEDVALVDGDLLGEKFDPSGRFDFVLGTTPTVDWGAVDAEHRREYASLSPHVRPADDDASWGQLYVERGRHHLADDGRMVLLADRDLATDEDTSEFRGEIAPLVRDVEDVPPGRYPDREGAQLVAVLEPDEGDRYDVDERAVWADPGAIERELAESAAGGGATDTRAAALSTPVTGMDVYPTDTDAPGVYLDMLYADYDGALVYDDPDARAGLAGYVSRAELRVTDGAPIGDHARPIPDRRCLDPAAGMPAVVETLGADRFAFVGAPGDPDGIVTRYDLNRLPVYHWLYARFVQFEVGLRDRLRGVDWSADAAPGTLPSEGVGDLVPDRLSNAQLSTLLALVDDAGIRIVDGSHDATLDDLRALRNTVAHFNTLVHTMGDRRTIDDPERGAPQLAAEVRLLEDAVASLDEG